MSTKCRIILFFICGFFVIVMMTLLYLILDKGGVIKPYFHLKGASLVTIGYHESYQDDGYIARSMFQNEKEKVKVTYPKSQAKDQYEIHYTYRNKTYVRLIQLKDMQPPKLTLKGETNVVLFEHEKYQEDGASAYDEVDKDVSHQIEIKSNVQNKVGTYEVKYFVKDQSGNSVSKIRYVTVVKDPSLKKLYYQHDSYDNTYEEWWFEKSKDHQRNQGARTQDFLQKYQAYYQGKNEKVLYLTFDEGGNDVTYIKEIASILDKHQVKASFFLTGNYLRSESQWVKEMVKNGHDILNHSQHHKDMPSLAHQNRVDEFVSEIMSWEKDYYKIVKEASKAYFRFPKGGFSERSLKMVSDLGYQSIFWSHAYYDYGETISKEEALASLLDHYHPGAIYLIHPSNKGNYEALEPFLLKMKELGYRFALLDELKET